MAPVWNEHFIQGQSVHKKTSLPESWQNVNVRFPLFSGRICQEHDKEKCNKLLFSTVFILVWIRTVQLWVSESRIYKDEGVLELCVCVCVCVCSLVSGKRCFTRKVDDKDTSTDDHFCDNCSGINNRKKSTAVSIPEFLVQCMRCFPEHKVRSRFSKENDNTITPENREKHACFSILQQNVSTESEAWNWGSVILFRALCGAKIP